MKKTETIFRLPFAVCDEKSIFRSPFAICGGLGAANPKNLGRNRVCHNRFLGPRFAHLWAFSAKKTEKIGNRKRGPFLDKIDPRGGNLLKMLRSVFTFLKNSKKR